MVSYSLVRTKLATSLMSLNPCCSGQWSRTRVMKTIKVNLRVVLILVVVDNGLVQVLKLLIILVLIVLILVVVDNGLVQVLVMLRELLSLS